MKVIIIGGVAAGTKAAAKIKRLDRSAEVRIYTKGKDISYAGCGLPYYIGGDIASKDELIVNSPETFSKLTGAEVYTECEVTSLNVEGKEIVYKNANNEVLKDNYDKLIIATGASPFKPNVKGINLNGVFFVRTVDDAINIKKYIEENNCKKAVVAGAGFIGLEVAENLSKLGLDVSVVDAKDSIMPNALDKEMADFAKKKLQEANIKVYTSTSLVSIEGENKVESVKTQYSEMKADIAIIAIGIRPATEFVNNTGINMDRGLIVVDEYMQTNIEDVYAAGDCAMVKNRISNMPLWSAMGSTANITARILAKNITGQKVKYSGALATGVVKLLDDLNCSRVGLTEVDAKQLGLDVETVICVLDDKAHYYPNSSMFIVKLIADKKTEKILGIQVLGKGAVDKMTDIAVTAISMNATLSDMEDLDFSYAPPFSTAINPFTAACSILKNKIQGIFKTISPKEYLDNKANGYTVIDAAKAPSIKNAKYVNIPTAEKDIEGIDKDAKLLLVCTRGKRAYFLQNKLESLGYKNTKVLEGGTTFNNVKVERNGRKLTAEEIKYVKSLGCLQDKRYDDIFNVRVITRNGKITAAEQIDIANAAKIYGSGEVTMTTRLTLEIQGVPYDKLDELFAYLKERNLETGGTGSKVRPVVSCKGTTCQYGLIDTFALSEKLHELYYVGYHDLSLPHKMKIAVGGCPNNCTKPDLNDIGIVGQKAPDIDLSKCRGCKVCQVENSCPIHTAKVIDKKIVIDPNACNQCGRCTTKCPFKAVTEGLSGYKVYIGGRWGKKIAQGKPLGKIFHSEEEVIEIVDKAIMLFRNEGISGERFSDTIARLGFDYVENKLLNETIDKEAIKKKTVIGGATC